MAKRNLSILQKAYREFFLKMPPLARSFLLSLGSQDKLRTAGTRTTSQRERGISSILIVNFLSAIIFSFS